MGIRTTPPYIAVATDFANAGTSWLDRGGGVGTGLSKFLMSMWVKPDSFTGSPCVIFVGDSNPAGTGTYVYYDATNFWWSLRENVAPHLYVGNCVHDMSVGNWYNVLFSVGYPIATSVPYCYINGVNKALTTNVSGSAVYRCDSTLNIGRTTGATQKFGGEMCEPFISWNQYLDFSQSANRDKFYDSATGKPPTNGNLITRAGFTPEIYLQQNAASFGVNSGSLGNLGVNGTLVAGTPP